MRLHALQSQHNSVKNYSLFRALIGREIESDQGRMEAADATAEEEEHKSYRHQYYGCSK